MEDALLCLNVYVVATVTPGRLVCGKCQGPGKKKIKISSKYTKIKMSIKSRRTSFTDAWKMAGALVRPNGRLSIHNAHQVCKKWSSIYLPLLFSPGDMRSEGPVW